jgi:glutamate racemase
VLGCTHYPYLIPQIQKIIGNKITIIDSGQAVAKQTKKVLEENNLLHLIAHKGFHQFYSNTDIKILEKVLNKNTRKIISYLDF